MSELRGSSLLKFATTPKKLHMLCVWGLERFYRCRDKLSETP